MGMEGSLLVYWPRKVGGGGIRGKRKESCPVGADRLLEHGHIGSHRVVEEGRLPKGQAPEMGASGKCRHTIIVENRP